MVNLAIMVTRTVINIVKIIWPTICIAFVLNLMIPDRVYAGHGNFYKGEDRYRGFYWFEDRGSVVKDKDLFQFDYPTPEQAQTSIEARKKALDDVRAQMVELAFREDVPPQILRQAVVQYKKLEAEMHEGAIRLVQASEMANFTNPELANVTEFPTNVFANKIKRGADEKQRITTIRAFARKFDLLLFANSDCPYCKAFVPVITNFAKDHGFTLDVTTLDGKAGKIAEGLGISGVPTLVAISKNGKELFEVSRGFSSVSELEASVILANNLSEEQELMSLQKLNQSKNKR